MSLTPYKQLEQEWQRLHAFGGALSLLRWDAAVMMPRGSADVRGEQIAAIEIEHHALLTSPQASVACSSARRRQRHARRLAARQPARDAAPARPCHRHPGVADLAPGACHFAGRGALDRGAREQGLRRVRAAPRRGAAPGARQGDAAGPGAASSSPYDALLDEFTPGLRVAEIDADLQVAVAAPADADPRRDRAPGRPRRRCRSPAGSRRASSAR